MLQQTLFFDENDNMYLACFTDANNMEEGKLFRIKKGEFNFEDGYNGFPNSDGKLLTVQYLGNVRGGAYPVKYLNLPMDDLRDLTIRQLKDGRPVWFGSDVGQFSDRKAGYLTTDAYAVDELFSTDFPMTKEQRLDYGESLMTHAMVITGVNLAMILQILSVREANDVDVAELLKAGNDGIADLKAILKANM